MRRAACIAALAFVLGSFARADQGWQDNQDGNNFACFDAASFAANNLNLSGGTYSTYASGLVVNSNPNASVTAWFVDPASGNDSNNGTTSGSALKTFKEWSRRVRGATGVATTVTLMNDDVDSDTIDVSCDGGVTIQGSETVVSTQTVTASQGRLAASNLANEITVSAFAWSPFLNTMLRVQGTQNYAAITKIVSTSVARLGELWNTSSSTQASSTGVANGAVVELVHTTKGPLQMIVTGRASPSVIDIAFDGSGPVHYSNTRVSRDGGFDGLQRVIFGGTTSTINTGAGLLMIGGIVKSSTSFGVTEGNLLTQGTAYNCLATTFQTSNLVKMRSAVMQDTTVTLAPANMELNGDFASFDLPAAAAGIALNQFGVGSTVIFTSGSHYGGGNDPSSWLWSIGQQTQVIYGAGAPPTMNAGLGVQINGGNVALGSLPVPISPFTGSGAIDSTAVAGCLQTDGSGNVSSTGTACGSGSGGVTSATGTAQRISVAPTTGAVVVDTIGGYYSGAVSSGNEDLGTALTNGLVCDTTTAGIAVLRTCTSGTDYQPPTAKTCTSGQFLSEIDVTGATVCSTPASGGTVTSVTGTSGQILCTPTSPNPVCSLIAAGTAGSCTNCSVTFDSLGRETSQASGTAPVTSIGVTAPITTTGGLTPTIGISLPSADVAFGTGTNVTGTGFFQWNGFNPGLTSLEELQIYNSNSSAAGLAGIRIGTSSAFTQGFSFSMIAPGWSSGGGLSVGDVLAEENAGSTAAVHFSNFGANGTIDFDTGGSRTKRLIIDSSGNVDVPQLSAGGVVKALTSQPGQLAIAAAGTDYQAPMSAADATVVFPTATTIRRAAVTGDCSIAAASNTCAVNSVSCAASPGLTGDATSTAGTCATKVVEIHESGGLGIPIGACTTDGQAFVKVAGQMTCRLPAGDLSNDYTAPWVSAIHETSGPQQLTIAGIPDTAPFLDVMGRDGVHGNTIIGTSSPFLTVADKLQYFMDVTAIPVTTGWIGTSDKSTFYSGVPIEYVMTHKVTTIIISYNLITNGIATGGPTIGVTRNGTGLVGCAFSFNSSTATGPFTFSCSSGSSSAADTYGLQWATSATGSLRFTTSLVFE